MEKLHASINDVLSISVMDCRFIPVFLGDLPCFGDDDMPDQSRFVGEFDLYGHPS